MKLRYQINLAAVTVLMAVAIAIGLAGALAINEVTLELNRKLLTSEVKNLLAAIKEAHRVLSDNRVDLVPSYVARAQDDLLSEFQYYRFGRTGRLMVYDISTGKNLVEGNGQEELDKEDLERLYAAGHGVDSCHSHSGKHLISFSTYAEWNWLVAVSVAAEEIMAARDRFLWQVAFILLCSLVAGICLFVWFSGRIVRPIRQLTAAAESVSQGKWDAPLPHLKGDSEIAQLSDIFREMSASLAETYQKLKENLDHVAQSREDLRVSREQFRALVETTSDLVWEVNEKGRYSYVSPQVTKLLGYPPEEMLGRSPDEFMAAAAETPPDLKERFLGGQPFASIERRIKCRDDSIMVIESSGTPFFDGSGACRGFRGIDRNITDRKLALEKQQQLQAQLIQAQKMESIGRLAGGVAHDFNNMLSVILGNIDLVMDEADPAMPSLVYFQEIKKAAERSAGITRQLLAFARKQTVNPQKVDLNESIGELLKMLHRLIGEDITLEWLPGRDIWPIQLDATQLDQILVNLCVNSRDAIGNTGTITISTRNTYLDAAFCAKKSEVAPGDYVALEVRDDGCGMSKEVTEHLFEPFFTTKELGKGTGLGLATVYGIVRQNEATIEATSQTGQGSTFTIYFPRYHAQQTGGAVEAAESGPAVARETILLVEDEEMVLKMTAMMLSRVGFTVLQAPGPHEALQIAAERLDQLDLVITDVVMPEMNGLDLMEKIKVLRPDIQCLFMSGYPADVIAHHGVLVKGVYFIQKPFTRDVLIDKIREIFADSAA